MDFDDIGLELNEQSTKPVVENKNEKIVEKSAKNRLLDAIDDFDNMPSHPKANAAFSAISSKGSRLKGAAAREGDSESDDEFGLKDEKIEEA